MGESIVATAEYDELLDSIKRTLAAGQLRAARAVTNVHVETYWQIGREIVDWKSNWPKVDKMKPCHLRISLPTHARITGCDG